jgi:hypothetical protein
LKTATLNKAFQLVAFSSKAGWLQHAGGVGRLIELRGPWRHQTLLERQFLEWNRVTVVLEHLLKSKHCYLEKPEWKTVPWALEPESKTLMVDLQGILCSMPGMMEDAAALHIPDLAPEQRLLLHQTLSNKIEGHLEELYAWRTVWEEANPHACFEVPNPSALNDKNALFATILHFSNLAAAIEVSMYNAILLLLCRLGYEVIDNNFNPNSPSLLPLSSALSSPRALYLPGHARSQQAIATEICRSADYHLLEKHSGVGAFCLLFPLRVAYQVFDDGAREKAWLEGLMKRVAELSGWEIGRNLGSDAAIGR